MVLFCNSKLKATVGVDLLVLAMGAKLKINISLNKEKEDLTIF